MKKFYTGLVKRQKLVIVVFTVLAVLSFFGSKLVAVNYEIADYLPAGTASTVSLELLEQEFGGGVPNARVMLRNVTIPQALEYKQKLKAIDGVLAVTWLDDSVDITLPLSSMDHATLQTHYKDGNAVFSVTIDGEKQLTAVEQIRQLIGQDNALTGSAVSTADATATTVTEVMKVTVIAVLFVLFVLILTTSSWAEPTLVLIGLGTAIILNKGSNLFFGEISFVTNASGSVLLLAVSLDYSVFLLHRFQECYQTQPDAKKAMVEALCKSTTSILSSGLTTVIGFLALVLMKFRLGVDLGLALSKGVAISLLTVFTLMPVLILVFHKWIEKTKHRSWMPSFRGLGKLIRKIAVPMALVFAIVVVPAYLASNANGYLYGSAKIFDEQTRYGADTEAIEEVFGKSDTYVLMVPKGDTATQAALSNELHTLENITDILSYVDIAGAQIPNAYLDADTLALLEGERYCRMVLSVNVEEESAQTFRLVEQIRTIAEKHYPGDHYLAGKGVSTYDMKVSITEDMTMVNLVAIGAVFLVLLLTMRSLIVPVLLVLGIESAIWLNMAVPYFADQKVFYLAYLIISSVQLGATVDYAILMTDRYRENRLKLKKKAAVVQTISDTFVSIMTSGSAMTVVGLLLGAMSSNQLLAQLGVFIGRGAIFSLSIVLLVLPGLLYLFDRAVIQRKKS